ncbi:hypothetical protein CFR79_06935 [Komagataeibacter saccharivorans]|uniref:hypothetical protein n=1 Tax=Komagataeibacter saccharivorans TaxID=265959 RepID=UPI000D7C3743|nr:hypothetical protein [Komagataeibacter saccharivorans]PYD50899.1 hypothetical protein CFR79_06935 [Komagataeibacter saccharivorans]GBQ40664.1 hypothetical protein AA0614_2066 [Komagataeibacter saccharivorans NRIC 0614]
MTRKLAAITLALVIIPLMGRAQSFGVNGGMATGTFGMSGGGAGSAQMPSTRYSPYGAYGPPAMTGGQGGYGGGMMPYMFGGYMPYGWGGMNGGYPPYGPRTYGPGSQTIVDGKPGFPPADSRPAWGSHTTVDGQ